MWKAIDGTPFGEPSKENFWPPAALFFILVVTVSGFFITSIFVAVVTDEYIKNYDNLTGLSNLSSAQQKWLRWKQLALAHRPKRKNPPAALFCKADAVVRAYFFRIVTHRWYRSFQMLLTFLTLCTLSIWHNGQDEIWDTVLPKISLVLTTLFFLEIILHIAGLGFRQYFRSKWNIIDFAVSLVATAAAMLETVFSIHLLDSVHKFTRITLTLKLLGFVKSSRRLKRLTVTLVYCLPTVFNVIFVMLITYFCFAVAGMNLWSQVRLGTYLDKRSNFRTLHSSLAVLFQLTTDKWTGIAHDCMVNVAPFCDPNKDCGSKSVGLLYFFSFHVVSKLILANLFVASILKHFIEETSFRSGKEIYDAETGQKLLTGLALDLEELEQFNTVWLRHCDRGNHEIMPLTCLPSFIKDLSQPLGQASKVSFRFLLLVPKDRFTESEIRVILAGILLEEEEGIKLLTKSYRGTYLEVVIDPQYKVPKNLEALLLSPQIRAKLFRSLCMSQGSCKDANDKVSYFPLPFIIASYCALGIIAHKISAKLVMNMTLNRNISRLHFWCPPACIR